MQDQFSRIIIFLIIVLSILHSGEALTCYKCPGNTTCESRPFIDSLCSVNETLCTIFTVELPNGTTTIARLCASSGFCGKQQGYVKTCYECNTDYCNASANNAVSTIIILTSGLITLLWTMQ